MTDKICVCCGKPLPKNRSKYCSKECSHKSYLLSIRSEKKPARKTKVEPFSDYIKAFNTAKKRGFHLSYGKWASGLY